VAVLLREFFDRSVFTRDESERERSNECGSFQLSASTLNLPGWASDLAQPSVGKPIIQCYLESPVAGSLPTTESCFENNWRFKQLGFVFA
jgi:hypothetical protein